MSNIYFAGAIYRNSDNQPAFDTVRPTGGLPYVYNDGREARKAFNVMKHHSALYLTTDGKKAAIVQRGEIPFDLTPELITLPKDVAHELQQAAKQLESTEV